MAKWDLSKAPHTPAWYAEQLGSGQQEIRRLTVIINELRGNLKAMERRACLYQEVLEDVIERLHDQSTRLQREVEAIEEDENEEGEDQ